MLDDRDDNDYDDPEIEYDKPTHSIDPNSYSGCFRSFFIGATNVRGSINFRALVFDVSFFGINYRLYKGGGLIFNLSYYL